MNNPPRDPLWFFALKVLAAVLAFWGAREWYAGRWSGRREKPQEETTITPLTEPEKPGIRYIQDLGKYPFDVNRPEATPIPADIQKRKGEEIAITGYLRPLSTRKGNRQYVLVEEYFFTCRGHSPQIHHQILVTLREGVTHEITFDPVTITGILDVGVVMQHGRVSSVYRMDCSRIEPYRK